jgi:hypothetical protein
MTLQIPETFSGTPHRKGHLKGFTGLHIISPQLPKEVVSLHADEWKVQIEKKFQQANIEIINTDTLFTGKTQPSHSSHHRLAYLLVSLNDERTTSPTPFYHLRITGYNKMDVFSKPNPQHIIWEAGTLVTNNKQHIEAQTETLIKEFIKDFQRANPNKSLNITQSR